MISIITVNLDHVAGLRRTVESVQSQTYRDFEHLIIDGGSTDGSREFIENHAGWFSYWVSEPDSGVYAAMNKGIRQATGDYVLFLNSGDSLLSSHVFKKIAPYLNEKDMLVGSMKNQTPRPFDLSTFQPFDSIWLHSLPHPATFIRRDLFERVGLYDESYRIVSDWIFFVKALFLHGASYRFVDVEVAKVEEGGLSRRKGSLAVIREERRRFVLENAEIRNSVFVERFFAMEEKLDDLSRSRLMRWLVRMGLFRYLKDLFERK